MYMGGLSFSRYRNETRALNLSDFVNDPGLVTPSGGYLYAPLSRSSVMSAVVDIIGDNIPDVVAIDFSNNKLPNLSAGLASTWPELKTLRHLDISHNPITYIIRGDFKYLTSLESLRMNHLDKCTKIDRTAFANLGALKSISMFGFPKTSYIDVKGILSNFNHP